MVPLSGHHESCALGTIKHMLVYTWMTILYFRLWILRSENLFTPDNTPSLMGCHIAAHGYLTLAFSSVGVEFVTWGTSVDATIWLRL